MFGYISKNELRLIDEYFQQYVKFTQFKQNNFEYIEKTGNKDLDQATTTTSLPHPNKH